MQLAVQPATLTGLGSRGTCWVDAMLRCYVILQDAVLLMQPAEYLELLAG